MKVIITGVAGFIGSNLAESILKDGHEIIGIDNLSYGQTRNIEAFKDHENFRFVMGDLANPLIMKDFRADIIVHLASQKIPRYTNALRTLDENYLMLRNVMNKCVIDGSKIVFASTSDVYGKNSQLPFSEDSDLLLGPTTIKRWAYALSKIYGEHLIIAHNDQYGLNYSICRFFGSYGPNQNLTWWGGPQSVFIGKALNKEPLEIHGDGKQTRTFTYIEDTIRGLKHCIFDEKANNQIFNIGSNPESEISITNLARMIWKLIHGESTEPDLNYIPYSDFGRYEDVSRRIPDISKMNQIFGFSPLYNLKDGLTKTIEWQRKITHQ